MDHPLRKKTKVAVIGAGVSGLCAAKYLLAERLEDDPENGHFEVTIFESKKVAGGIWNQTPADDLYATPMYPSCNTNVPRTMMQYEGVEYPDDTPLFPRNSVVKKYLHEYAEELEDEAIFHYGTEVTGVKQVQRMAQQKWKIDVKDTVTGKPTEHYFDCVVVALGTFAKPFVPALFETSVSPEIRIMHSKEYRTAHEFDKKKVLVVGSGPSYWDMSQEISKVCKGDLLVSVKQDEAIVLSSKKQRQVSEVSWISKASKLVLFKGGKNSIAPQDIDIILLCTGYLYDFPMFPCIKTTGDKKRILSLYDHMICIKEHEDPTQEDENLEAKKTRLKSASTLAFVGLLTMDNVFLVAEAQGALIARYFSGRWTKPQTHMVRDRNAEYEELKTKDRHGSRRFHNMAYPSDAHYVDRLFEQCLASESPATMGTGKTPPFHSLYLHWVRTQIGVIRAAFNTKARNNEDGRFSTLESLGFNFGQYNGSKEQKKKTIMMDKFRTLMEEKNDCWKEGYIPWVVKAGEWSKRWDVLETEWVLVKTEARLGELNL
ncbi:uncharacterized protein RAG0_06392 [Rhynchosporium agropyri]|uniref:Flavin-containing monooxygenase n=1 Tax=Rhynchosporium agropyri TaxID=914238 RepID=A0A1E1KGP8_9HELO|nr:uncharacterized protein RAG0_06392 [Rhynchosporium agropyri]